MRIVFRSTDPSVQRGRRNPVAGGSLREGVTPSGTCRTLPLVSHTPGCDLTGTCRTFSSTWRVCRTLSGTRWEGVTPSCFWMFLKVRTLLHALAWRVSERWFLAFGCGPSDCRLNGERLPVPLMRSRRLTGGPMRVLLGSVRRSMHRKTDLCTDLRTEVRIDLRTDLRTDKLILRGTTS